MLNRDAKSRPTCGAIFEELTQPTLQIQVRTASEQIFQPLGKTFVLDVKSSESIIRLSTDKSTGQQWKRLKKTEGRRA